MLLAYLSYSLLISIIAILLFRRWFFKKKKQPFLEKEQLQFMSVGAINTIQTKSSMNTLSTQLTVFELDSALKRYWDIVDRDSALNAFHDIRVGGYNKVYNFLYPILSNTTSKAARDLQIMSRYDDSSWLIGYADNIVDCVRKLKNDQNLPFDEPHLKKGILAWDLGHWVSMSRMAYDKKYISEKECWNNIVLAHKVALENYSNWKEFGHSYLIGKAMWGGDTLRFRYIYNVIDSLIKDPNSLWNRFPMPIKKEEFEVEC